ncbi:MAG: peptide deformylase [Epsilonproteobacteria bacterium]|nr:peptide deformylase [Campylobacterota bacterium]
MSKELLTYPDTKLLQISGFIREFDDNLFKLLDRMKEVAKANNLKGLAAIQIGVPKKVIVFKKDKEFLELINPTIYFHKGFIESKEEDETIPGKEFTIKRYESVKIMYYDRNNNQKFLDATGEEAIWLQRKIDLTFGGLPLHKLPKKEQKEFLKNYEISGACPTSFVKDKILVSLRLTLIAEYLLFGFKFFSDFAKNLLSHNVAILILNFLILIFYAIYAKYETQKYKNCTSCQGANAIGTVAIYSIPIILFFILNHYF